MHKIRKTYASKVYRGTNDITVAKDVLGHADETTTLKHYIYSTAVKSETDDMIRKALGDIDVGKGTARDSAIIRFPGKEKRSKTR